MLDATRKSGMRREIKARNSTGFTGQCQEIPTLPATYDTGRIADQGESSSASVVP